jgi:hypothetical protein
LDGEGEEEEQVYKQRMEQEMEEVIRQMVD